MATHKAPPWRCRLCMKTLKGHMPRCGWCGEAWQNCYDAAFVPGDRAPSTPRKYQEQPAATPWATQQTSDAYAHWGQEQGPVRYQSPRPKARRRQGRGRGRAQQGMPTAHVPPPVPPPVPHKGAGKGTVANAAASNQLLAPPPPPPAFLAPLERGPASQFVQPAAATENTTLDSTGFAPNAAAPTEAEIRLKSLMRELRKAPEEKLTPAIQEEMKKNTQREQDMDAKGLHRAVNDVKKARRAVSTAVSARAKLMTDWKTFLQQSVETWREYTLMFQTQEKTLQDNLIAAQEGLAQAKRSFEEHSEALRESGVQDISDEDKETANAEDMMEYETTKRIHEGLSTMVNSLQELTEKAEIEEQQAKRQRRAVEIPDEDAGDGTSLPSQPSMQPFGKPGSK